jgi:hypothetical protein
VTQPENTLRNEQRQEAAAYIRNFRSRESSIESPGVRHESVGKINQRNKSKDKRNVRIEMLMPYDDVYQRQKN